MNDDWFDRSKLDFEEWVRTPNREDIAPDEVMRSIERSDFIDDLKPGDPMDEPLAVVLTHTDADGLTSGAIPYAAYRGRVVVRPIGYEDPFDYDAALGALKDSGLTGYDLFICDFNPPEGEPINDRLAYIVEDHADNVTWYDHHQWTERMVNTHADAGIDLNIDTDECTASLMWPDFREQINDDVRENLDELVEVTKDRDLWINEDPRSQRLNVLSRVTSVEDYISIGINQGVNHDSVVESMIDNRIDLDDRIEDVALNNIDRSPIDTDTGFDVGFAYISDGVSSNIGNTMIEDVGYSVAVVQHTDGSSSIYSHSESGEFDRCHEVARTFGGGGHPTASGFGPVFDSFHGMANYWVSEGVGVQGEILTAIAEVYNDEQE